jgi:hypothetical protein
VVDDQDRGDLTEHVEHLVDGRPHTRWTCRGVGGTLAGAAHGAGELMQVAAFDVVEAQRPGEGVEHASETCGWRPCSRRV